MLRAGDVIEMDRGLAAGFAVSRMISAMLSFLSMTAAADLGGRTKEMQRKIGLMRPVQDVTPSRDIQACRYTGRR
jgi:hypothetical protein